MNDGAAEGGVVGADVGVDEGAFVAYGSLQIRFDGSHEEELIPNTHESMYPE